MGNDTNKKDTNFFWILWGIGLAFGVQVLYDGVGVYSNPTSKFYYGLLIEAVLLIGLYLYGFTIVKKAKA